MGNANLPETEICIFRSKLWKGQERELCLTQSSHGDGSVNGGNNNDDDDIEVPQIKLNRQHTTISRACVLFLSHSISNLFGFGFAANVIVLHLLLF